MDLKKKISLSVLAATMALSSIALVSSALVMNGTTQTTISFQEYSGCCSVSDGKKAKDKNAEGSLPSGKNEVSDAEEETPVAAPATELPAEK